MKVKELRWLLSNMNDNDEVVIKEHNENVVGIKSVEEVHEIQNFDYIDRYGQHIIDKCIIETK